MSIDNEFSIETFLQSLRNRDLPAEFTEWYAGKHKEDPDGYPDNMHASEWLDVFSSFICPHERKPRPLGRGEVNDSLAAKEFNG